jgi:hypothetical protein
MFGMLLVQVPYCYNCFSNDSECVETQLCGFVSCTANGWLCDERDCSRIFCIVCGSDVWDSSCQCDNGVIADRKCNARIDRIVQADFTVNASGNAVLGNAATMLPTYKLLADGGLKSDVESNTQVTIPLYSIRRNDGSGRRVRRSE